MRKNKGPEVPAIGILTKGIHDGEHLLGLCLTGAEMHRDHATAPFHHQPGCYRRVYAAGEQSHDPSLAAQRQAAWALDRFSKNEGMRRLHFDGPGPDCPACQGRLEYLEGSLDGLASHSCSPGRAGVDLDRGLDLSAVETALRGAGFQVRVNRFCLTAGAGGQRFTVFPDGRISLEGGEPADLNRFIATYLGI